MSEPSSTEAVQAPATVTTPAISRRSDLVQLAVAALTAHGLAPDFSAAALAELASIAGPAQEAGPSIRDLRALPWCSIDDDSSGNVEQMFRRLLDGPALLCPAQNKGMRYFR